MKQDRCECRDWQALPITSSCCELQVPLQLREVRLLGPKAEGPLSDYRNVQLHAVELARSENTCKNNNHGQQCLTIRGLELGNTIRFTLSIVYTPVP
jgi:hypothetical protein